jgi:hypothetical protein
MTSTNTVAAYETCRRPGCLIPASLCSRRTGLCTACKLITDDETAAALERASIRAGAIVALAPGELALVITRTGDTLEIERPGRAVEQVEVAAVRVGSPSDRTRYATQLHACRSRLN